MAMASNAHMDMALQLSPRPGIEFGTALSIFVVPSDHMVSFGTSFAFLGLCRSRLGYWLMIFDTGQDPLGVGVRNLGLQMFCCSVHN
jgi:hypothetical protein